MSSKIDRELECENLIETYVNDYFKDSIIPDLVISDIASMYSEYERYIKTVFVQHNSDVLKNKIKECEAKRKRIKKLKPLEQKEEKNPKKKKEVFTKNESSSFYEVTINKYLEIKELCYSEKDVYDCLLDGDYDINTIKLFIKRDIDLLEACIIDKTKNNPLDDLKEERELLKRLILIFNVLIDYKKKDEIKENEIRPFVILLKENNGNDVLFNYINDNKNYIPIMKKNIEKFFRGECSNSKKIKGKKENLLEIVDVNGTRLLYFDLGNNNYVLAGIFLKDADKSVGIDTIYDNAIAIYRSNKEYILENINNKEFRNEQEELVRKLFIMLNGEKVIISGKKI